MFQCTSIEKSKCIKKYGENLALVCGYCSLKKQTPPKIYTP